MPAAVGFSLGIDRAPVVSIAGDGAALYSPQALWTAAHERLPVTFVVINNREYNILKRFMRSQPHYASTRANRFIGMDILDPAIDFLALAASMGLPAHRIDRAAEIAPALEAAISSGAPDRDPNQPCLRGHPLCSTMKFVTTKTARQLDSQGPHRVRG
jgi:benzoylformate decarboxylase